MQHQTKKRGEKMNPKDKQHVKKKKEKNVRRKAPEWRRKNLN